MALSVVDLYRDVLPRTNCGECGYPTCMAFGSMVVADKLSLRKCPHLSDEVVKKCQAEMESQYADEKWTRRDMAKDALLWAQEKAASMAISDLPQRIGGELDKSGDSPVLVLPYFTEKIRISEKGITHEDNSDLGRWEQVFIYNHMAQGGSAPPTGNLKALVEIPNTVSKIKSMKEHVEIPLIRAFSGKTDELFAAAKKIGGEDLTQELGSADLTIRFHPLPKIPVVLMFWDEDAEEGFEAKATLLFDKTITMHLDIESIMFLSERLRELLVENA